MNSHALTIRGRNLGLVALTCILIAAVIAIPFLANASTFSGGLSVNIEGGTVQNDLYLAGFDAKVSADVEGDVSVAAFRTDLTGTVGGSVHVLGGTTTISGTVNGTLYVFGGITRLEGTVNGNVIVCGGRLVVSDSGRIGGDLIVFSAQAEMDGNVGGKLYGSTLVYDQNGAVSGNLELQSDRISLGGNATIGDDFRYQSQTNANMHVNAIVGGETIRTNSTPWTGVGDGALAPYGTMLRIVWSLVVGAVAIALMPRVMYRVAEHAAPLVGPGILGVLGMVFVPVIAALSMLSVLLLPVGAIAMLLFLVALYATQIVVSITIGRAVLPKRWRDGSRGFLLFAMVVGMIVIGALRMAPVPFLNAITMVLVTVWGLGAILMLFRDVTSYATRSAMRRG